MADSSNPFFAPSVLPYQLPPFSEIRDEHYRPAFLRGFEEHLAEVRAITAQADLPTFENTMIPLEKGGQVLQRVAEAFYNKSSSDSNDTTNALEEEIALLEAEAKGETGSEELHRFILTFSDRRRYLRSSS